MAEGKIFAFESMGLVDGPGIRTVVFFQGCPLSCSFCHNPESRAFSGGETVKAGDLMKKILRFRPFFERSGGGVTFSGGEPLMQGEFLLEMLKACKKENIHTCLDTSGVGRGNYEEILSLCDTVLYDVKAIDSDSYKEICNCDISETEKFQTALNESNAEIIVRQVVIPGINDTDSYMEDLKKYINEKIPRTSRVELLPFHKMGEHKYEKMGLVFPLEKTKSMDKEKTKMLWEKHFKIMEESKMPIRKEFTGGRWQKEINVRDFIQKNYCPYEGDAAFLSGPSEKTKKVWEKCLGLLSKELEKGGVLDVETKKISGILSFEPGYIDKENEVIFGLQTDAPLKRMVNPYGGMRMAEQSLNAYGYTLDPTIKEHFSEYRKTHNQGVFDAYPQSVREARHAGLITGLPDAYGRGRIIGDYRRVALYGTERLIEDKKLHLAELDGEMTDATIRLREELSMQIRALMDIEIMADGYGIDLRKPAVSAREAVQALYMAYLAGTKENNGAATSIGRTSTFLDIYIQRDLEAGIITEEEAQELVDQLIIKLRLIRHLRTPDYNVLFGGDPTWVTESIGGMGINGKSLVTKNSFRYLRTLINLGSSPEPNLTVLWDENLPENFKKYCAEISVKTDSIQYENDDVMRPLYGDDYAIACCVSAMRLGKQMQFFGARCNLAKSLLYAINGGVDEITGQKIIPDIEPLKDEILSFENVWSNYEKVLKYVAGLYVKANNIIHFMHDKYAYEASQLALHDTDPEKLMAFGVAGLSVATDSLSAIKFAKVYPVRNEEGTAIDFKTEGDFPKYGNDDDKVDDIAVSIVTKFITELKKHKLYRDARHTLSVLTITSNVMYGKKTGSTPDGRKLGEPLAPGANPMHSRDISGALASLNSVAKIPYRDICQDGVSNTFSIVPDALGKTEEERIDNLVSILDGYFSQGAQHLNVNVLNRETLIEAYEHPDKHPMLTIRVSGYAVNFHRLSKEQQREVISRTFHESM